MRYSTIGKNSRIDKSAIIGYKPDRKIIIKATKIGKNARVRSNSVIYTNVILGDNLETGHNSVIREENIIGDNFKIWNNSVVDYGCLIGSRVKIHSNVYVAQFTTIEDDVFFAPGVIIANDMHPGCGKCMKGPTIKSGVKIGVNSTILPGVTVGKNSFVGSGSVVTKDIPENMVVFGNPAKITCSVYELRCKSGLKDYPYKI